MRIRWRGFELPTRCIPVEEKLTDTYGMFIVEPFERGFGHTLGNGLRRILLSSIEGAAVVSARFEGIEHEFSTIPGVYEDVQQLILNIKEIRFKMDTGVNRGEVTVEKKGEGEVCAKDITCPPEIEIVNGDHILASLTDSKTVFKAEMIVEKRRGYMDAEENESRLKAQEEPVGYLCIDSTFSPVLRVRYSVDDTRVGKITNYDKLILELWTDGTISPEDSLLEAANIYKKHLNCFTRFRDIGEELEEDKKPGLSDEKLKKEKEKLQKKFETPITELGLSVRTINCLTSEGLNIVEDIVEKPESEITKIRNFGKTSAKELKTKLTELGLTYQMSLEEELEKLEEQGVD
jgi:DNA-directed RNA polymerase subunit alpha